MNIIRSMNTAAPRPLDRLWLRFRAKLLQGAKRPSPKPATRSGTPRATLEQKLALRDKYGIKGGA